jgi:hypothetical protein
MSQRLNKRKKSWTETIAKITDKWAELVYDELFI